VQLHGQMHVQVGHRACDHREHRDAADQLIILAEPSAAPNEASAGPALGLRLRRPDQPAGAGQRPTFRRAPRLGDPHDGGAAVRGARRQLTVSLPGENIKIGARYSTLVTWPGLTVTDAEPSQQRGLKR
jgi:hypothetical protein